MLRKHALKSPVLLLSWTALSLLLLGVLLLSPVIGAEEEATAKRRVDFNRDVQPILSDNCFACHGFDANKRQAGLRLDTSEGARQRLASGKAAIVPGKAEQSELMQRVTTPHAALQMPPADGGKKLTRAQIETLRRWIEQGGEYAAHWSFVPPKRPALPPVKDPKWPLNPIDRFILARLEKENLRPSPVADRQTLIRRLSFDLTGLPPTVAEVDAFLADKQPGAYERLVDRLLASPRYGERMTLKWLDLARYADTHGYHIDSHRDMWRWRDWVIDAFNRNLPYDRFTVEQIAGDLLPGATLDQKIATGFNRNHPINFEGGAIPEEYQTAYVMDRVDTTTTAFMGLTVSCAKCHDHKYDPITQKDYYRFYAFFNNIKEKGLDGQKGNAAPFIKAPLPGQQEQLNATGKKIAEVEKAMKTRAAETASAQPAWQATTLETLQKSSAVTAGLTAHYGLDEKSARHAHDVTYMQPLGVFSGKPERVTGQFGEAVQLDGSSYITLGDALDFDRSDKFSYGAWVKPTGREAMTVLSRMDDKADFRGWDMYLSEGKAFVHLIHQWQNNAIRVNTKMAAYEPNQWTHLLATYDGSGKAKGIKIYVNGKPAEIEITHDTLTDTIRTSAPAHIGRRNPSAAFKGIIDEVRAYRRELSSSEAAQLAAYETLRPLLTVAPAKRTKEQQDVLSKHYLQNNDAPYQKLSAELTDWRKKYAEQDNAIPTTMVMEEMDKPRDTHLLVRGQYDLKGEKVAAGTPAVLPSLPKNAPANRLALAQWLVSPSHPLTARVAVNRFWAAYFGTGLVRTAEDFGTQGERPSHPELLDWLATEFIHTGWDIKKMQRLIVTSAAYRQSSRVTLPLLEKDPENRLLARAPRLRLPAEFVRDQALAVSGLLVPGIGGPSVRPYQPAGLWEEMSFGSGFTAQKYEQDHGEALYRRSMYTFWKRTVPPPSLQTFDAPEREFCVVRRSATNTPLQALVLMNDPTYVEASRKFAERILTEAPDSPDARIRFAFRAALSRAPKQAEIKALMSVYNTQIAAFRNDAEGAKKLLAIGESPRSEKLDTAELAAWTTVASVLFNLDETITKG